jgi:hypothetical protein
MWKEVVWPDFKALLWHAPGETEETLKNCSQDRWCPGWDTNYSLHNTSQALPLESLLLMCGILAQKIVYILLVLRLLWALAPFQFSDLFTIGRTPWMRDQFVARYTANIRVLSGIWTHNHSVRESEDSSCLRPLGYRDRPQKIIYFSVK